MRLHKWDEMAEEQVTDLLTRRFISGEKMTVARFFLKKGCVVAAHSHPNEQMSTILSGALKFLIHDREVIVRAGETLQIPANTPHSAEAIEDTDALDVFAPTRSDWVEGNDDYLRGKPRI